MRIRSSGESGERATREIRCVAERKMGGGDHRAREGERGRVRMRVRKRERELEIKQCVCSPLEMPSAKVRGRNPGCRAAPC